MEAFADYMLTDAGEIVPTQPDGSTSETHKHDAGIDGGNDAGHGCFSPAGNGTHWVDGGCT